MNGLILCLPVVMLGVVREVCVCYPTSSVNNPMSAKYYRGDVLVYINI